MLLGAIAMNGVRAPARVLSAAGTADVAALEADVRRLLDGIRGVLSGPGASGSLARGIREGLRACRSLKGTDRADYLRKLKANLTGIVSAVRGASWGSPRGRAGAGMALAGLLGATDHVTLPPTRASCLMCVQKHLGSAYVLVTETRHGYPHMMMAVGHLQEAEDESQEYGALHEAIRDARKAYQLQDVMPDWVKLRELHEAALASVPTD